MKGCGQLAEYKQKGARVGQAAARDIDDSLKFWWGRAENVVYASAVSMITSSIDENTDNYTNRWLARPTYYLYARYQAVSNRSDIIDISTQNWRGWL